MKKQILLLSAFFIGFYINAQNCSLTFYSESGQGFIVTLNGQKRNQTPTSNVRIEGLNSGMAYKASVSVEDGSGSIITKTIYMEPNTQNSVNVKVNKNGDWVLRYMGAVPAPATNNNVANTTKPSTKTTNTTSTNPNGSFSMNVNINENDNNASISMNVNDANVSSTSSTTYTTTTSTSNTNSNVNTNSARCDYPMDGSDYESGKKSIESKTFNDAKLTIAKQIIKANCPTADQVKGFVELFTFESGKVEIAKYAFDYVYDKGNYYKVNDAFTFESSISELNEYIENK